jgi:hypothetical protein
MKNINTKALMVAVLLAASFLSTPMMVSGYDNENNNFYEQSITDPSMLITSFQGFGSIFNSFGYAGKLIGRVFEMLLMQGLTNFEQKELLPGVWVMSASVEEEENFTRTYYGEHEIYTIPYEYDQSPIDPNNNGFAYCDVVKTGSVKVNITIGAGVTLIIWDSDGSFIRAVEQLVSFFNRLRIYMESNGPSDIPSELIREGVKTIAWFIIHINDIFTGDELFTLNPITWQKVELTPIDFALTKTWRVSGNDWRINPQTDTDLFTAVGGTDYNNFTKYLNDTAKAIDDSYMQWLLTPTNIIQDVTTAWTSFTFDLIQLWMKNFEIHINLGQIFSQFSVGGPIDVAGIFQGVDIDLYLFTHHLAGAFLYNDTNGDGTISSKYSPLKNSLGDNITTPDGRTVEVPDRSEITHRIVLNSVGDFEWQAPHITGANKFSWGLDLNSAIITPVPIGVDLESYVGAKSYALDYIKFGFTFEPDTSSLPVLKAPTKLDQFFAPWNASLPSADFDLGIVYLSTVLHFRLSVDVIGEDTTKSTPLLKEDDYNNSTHQLSIGNYIGSTIAPKLEFVDIAGEQYSYGSFEGEHSAPANSNTIPIALYETEIERHDTFEDESGVEFQTFATDISLNISFNVFAYAVCFPEFNGGTGIWHDPTFNVYMVFEAQGFWAIILLVAGVGLVGVATILIKRRKDGRF